MPSHACPGSAPGTVDCTREQCPSKGWESLFPPHKKITFLIGNSTKNPKGQSFTSPCASLGVKLSLSNFEITLNRNSVFPKATLWDPSLWDTLNVSPALTKVATQPQQTAVRVLKGQWASGSVWWEEINKNNYSGGWGENKLLGSRAENSLDDHVFYKLFISKSCHVVERMLVFRDWDLQTLYQL